MVIKNISIEKFCQLYYDVERKIKKTIDIHKYLK